jgi:hypothetical protein
MHWFAAYCINMRVAAVFVAKDNPDSKYARVHVKKPPKNLTAEDEQRMQAGDGRRLVAGTRPATTLIPRGLYKISALLNRHSR